MNRLNLNLERLTRLVKWVQAHSSNRVAFEFRGFLAEDLYSPDPIPVFELVRKDSKLSVQGNERRRAA